MASGFIVLPDGRCFSRRSYFHDAVVNEIKKLVAEPNLRHWLTEQLPGPDDTVDFGWGWLRASDQSSVQRFIDMRLMTEENQLLILEAATRAATTSQEENLLKNCLSDLADMVARLNKREDPLSKSDWREVIPPQGEKIGPGW